MITAISLRARLPHSNVRVLRSPSIGVIGVGEASTPAKAASATPKP